MQNLHQGHLHVYIVMLPLKNNMYLKRENITTILSKYIHLSPPISWSNICFSVSHLIYDCKWTIFNIVHVNQLYFRYAVCYIWKCLYMCLQVDMSLVSTTRKYGIYRTSQKYSVCYFLVFWLQDVNKCNTHI